MNSAPAWQMSTVAGISTALVGGGTPAREVPSLWSGGIPWVTPGELTGLKAKYLDSTAETISASGLSSSGARLLPENALLVTTRATLGSVALTKAPVATNQGFRSIVFKSDVHPDFYYHLFRTLKPEMERRASGTTFLEISGKQFAEIEVPLPPIDEQQRIAEILDTVDEQIRATGHLREKWRLARTGIVHDLTRGDWPLVRLGDLAGHVTSGSRGWARYYAEEGAKFIRIGNLTRSHINLRFESLTHVAVPRGSEGSRTGLQPGDVLISITADLGAIGVVPDDLGEAYINQHIALVRVDPTKANPRWVGHFLSAPRGQSQFRRLNDQGAKAGLNLPTVANLEVALPSAEEQRCAVASLDEIDVRIAGLGEEIVKLTRLRSGLMADLLTGRVRVLTGVTP